MCLEHGKSHRISRRGLGSMFLGAAGLSLLPLTARAADISTLCVTCIDYRFVTKDVTWLNTELDLAFNNYDIVALAGASLAATKQPNVPQDPSALFDQIKLAKSLHTKIDKILLLDHMDCGAYKKAFDNGNPGPDLERRWHQAVMPVAAKAIRNLSLGLNTACYLMPLEGRPWTIEGWTRQ